MVSEPLEEQQAVELEHDEPPQWAVLGPLAEESSSIDHDAKPNAEGITSGPGRDPEDGVPDTPTTSGSGSTLTLALDEDLHIRHDDSSAGSSASTLDQQGPSTSTDSPAAQQGISITTGHHTEPDPRTPPQAASTPPPSQPNPTTTAATFAAWHDKRGEYKVGSFVLLLVDEFCRRYALYETASTLQRELASAGIRPPPPPATQLWGELVSQCRALQPPPHSLTDPAASSSALERLVDVCVNPVARRAALTLDLATAAQSPVRICASPKRLTGHSLMDAYHQSRRSPMVRPSQRPSGVTTGLLAASVSSPILSASSSMLSSPGHGLCVGDWEGLPHCSGGERHPEDPEPEDDDVGGLHLRSAPDWAAPDVPRRTSITTKKPRKKRKPMRSIPSSSPLSAMELTGPNGMQMQSQAPTQPQGPPTSGAGTLAMSGLIEAHRSELQRDRNATRHVERELRHMRLEHLTGPVDPRRAQLHKRLGFAAQDATTRVDPYVNELILERYGFAKRQHCALCQYAFLPVNLPHRVSFKCVMDVHDVWGYALPDRATSSRFRAPFCYDAVQVCRMCAQIVFQHTTSPPCPESPDQALPARIRSGKLKTRSLSSLPATRDVVGPDGEEEDSFCSDPYALPPLLGEDVADHHQYGTGAEDAEVDGATGQRRAHRRRRQDSLGSSGFMLAHAHAGDHAGDGAKSHTHMTEQEWEVIQPARDQSTLRQVLRGSLHSIGVAGVPPQP